MLVTQRAFCRRLHQPVFVIGTLGLCGGAAGRQFVAAAATATVQITVFIGFSNIGGRAQPPV
jgi:hypothetical protein